MKEKYLVKYYWIQSDHIFASPTFHHEEIIETETPQKLQEYIESQTDDYGHLYKKNNAFGFDYISNQGAVKVSDYKPEIITI